MCNRHRGLKTHWFEQSTRAKDIQEVESFTQKLVYQDKKLRQPGFQGSLTRRTSRVAPLPSAV